MELIRNRTFKTTLAVLVGCACLDGCAPPTFDGALQTSIEQNQVADPAAQRADAAWYLRFDALLLSDLDDAIAASDVHTKRQGTADTYRAAARLAQAVAHAEIDRLPAQARSALAARFQIAASPTSLRERFDRAADDALNKDIAIIDTAPMETLQRKLITLRRSVSALPDDRGRLGRQVTLCLAALPAWIGLENEEAKLRTKRDAQTAIKMDHIAMWRPEQQPGDDLLAQFAPTILVEWPQKRTYPEADDRIGGARLHRSGRAIAVSIETTDPHLYAYRWTAKIRGKRYEQLVYVWWFPERPEMVANDPSAGHIDGGMLRLTLDSQHRPIIGESNLNCGCGHAVFVSRELERAARSEFGEPLPGNRFALEQNLDRTHDVIIADEFAPPPASARPVIFVSAGYHEVCKLSFVDANQVEGLRAVEETRYKLSPYDSLDALPLDDGVGSMFGPDGLVHNAGRPEGYLLAPTGILSAGQPRKRGVQRVRWDDYLLDDPHLLERTLRLPKEF